MALKQYSGQNALKLLREIELKLAEGPAPCRVGSAVCWAVGRVVSA